MLEFKLEFKHILADAFKTQADSFEIRLGGHLGQMGLTHLSWYLSKWLRHIVFTGHKSLY